MLGLMGNSSVFAKIAGRGGRAIPEIKFVASVDDPYIQALSCNGTIVIESIKGGVATTQSYSDLNKTMVSIDADANTQVTIKGWVKELYFTAYNDDPNVEDYEGFSDLTSLDLSGTNVLTALSVDYATLTELDVTHNTNLETLICGDMSDLTELDLAANTALTYLNCYSCTGLTELDLAANTALTYLDCYSCTGLTELDLAANTALTYLNCGSCTGLTELDLAANTALTYLNCGSCTGLTELDLAANTALTTLNCYSCTGLTAIYYPATNSSVSTAIAGAITDATSTTGTVYTDSTAAYYSTIETAANNKGWTIAALS